MDGPLGDQNFTASQQLMSSMLQQSVVNMLPVIGAPVSVYLLSDLLLDTIDVSAAKLCIFANAYRVDDALAVVIRRKLQQVSAAGDGADSKPTLVFYHAPGLINGNTGKVNVTAPGSLVMAGLRVEASQASLDTIFAAKPRPVLAGAPDFAPLAGHGYAHHSGGLPAAASAALMAPWVRCGAGWDGDLLAVDNSLADSGAPQHRARARVTNTSSRCTVLGTASHSGIPTLCWCDHPSHNTLFSASPGLPIAAMRAVVQASGLHVWAPAGVQGCDKGATSMGAFVAVNDVSAHQAIGVAKVAAPPPGFSGTQEELCTVWLPRPAATVLNLATGVRLTLRTDSTSFVDLSMRNTSQLYLFTWQRPVPIAKLSRR